MSATRKLRGTKTGTSRSSVRQNEREKALRILIFGAGRMGTALGRALRREGHRIDVVVTKHATTARRAAELIGGRSAPLTTSQMAKSPPDTLERLSRTSLLLISTPDDDLESAAKQLAHVLARSATNEKKGRRIALHTSGATPSSVLSPLASHGFAVGSLHPLVSIADPAKARDPFRGAHFCVEGDRAAMRVAQTIVKDLGGYSFTIPSEAKPLYHAAAAISSGHVVALIDLAIEMLEECGLSRPRAQDILAPLLNSTVTNLSAKTPAKALTGPFSRGDIATIRKHLAAMKSKNKDDAARVYGALGRRLILLARTMGGDRKALDEIAKLISS